MIQILSCVKGAEQAVGTTVIIDVFRAFTLEAYAFANGCEKIVLVRDVQDAFDLKQKHPDWILIGERQGKKVDGFDFGNSPYAVAKADFTGKTIVHTTTNGVQGIVSASHADAIMTGAFVNAAATVRHIQKTHPDHVSIVAMGWENHQTEEDQLCAEYLSAMLENRTMPDIDDRLDALRMQEGAKFFNPRTQDIFPKEDFPLCISKNIFDFVIEIGKENGYDTARRKDA
ncbi:MAG: 2-phosphosulfolactate phosphatase [Bulleidia sp.]